MGRLAVLAFLFVGVLALKADAAGARRVALIIGNGTYEAAGVLANPVNDALDLAAKLRGVGFEVIEGHDLGKRDLERKIGDFADALAGAGVGMLFYAGHGLQVDGRNYIVPVDARLDVPVKLQLEAVPIDEILDIMEQQTTTSLVFLDACRNNPFARGLTPASRSARPLSGLAQFDATRGSFIAFSTAPGAVAMDGSGRNSPFAAALLAHVDTPGQSINDLMIAVRRDVVAATGGQQRPWEQGSLIERFEFVPDGSAPAPVANAPAAAAPSQGTVAVAALERSVGDAGAIEEMLRRDYLLPDPAAIPETVRRLYGPTAKLFGVDYGIDAIVKAKTDWFAQFASWTLALEPGTLVITPRGETAAEAIFSMRYDYLPKDKAAARAVGTTRVRLGLARTDAGWRIVDEKSE